MISELMTALASPLDLGALERRVEAMRQAGVSGVALSVDEADALIAAARERDALEVRLAAINMAKLTPVETYLRDTVVTMSALLKDTEAQLAAECQQRERCEHELEREAAGHSQTLAERDHYHDAADNLAHAVVRLCVGEDALVEEVIGEHTSANDPWARALELAEQCLGEREVTDAMRAKENARLRTALESKDWRISVAKAAAERAYENQKCVAPLGVPQLLFAPIWGAINDAIDAALARPTEGK